MKRRQFLKYSIAGSAAVVLPMNLFGKTVQEKKYANDIVDLGQTGIKASRLAMGTGTHGVNKTSNQTRRLGIQGLAKLLNEAYQHGINFWDSADQYGTHPHLKEALKTVPRDKVVILTKTHATTADEMKADLDRFRKELGTDYIDIVLLHFMTDPNWPQVKKEAMQVLEDARKQGIIRAHGVSCHTLGALEAAANSDWVQIDLARINFAGVRMDAELPVIEKILKKMHHDGKSIIGMKIFGAGSLRDQVDKSLRYILKQDFVDAFTIGQENGNEMMDLIKKIPQNS
ncbi:aldo/keto reductase [candidate division KSB1 bacterium]|nr:aldo/keto reductase [candidate division KSB1 bacterium]